MDSYSEWKNAVGFFSTLIEGDTCIANGALLNYFPLGQNCYKYRNIQWLQHRHMGELLQSHTSNEIITILPTLNFYLVRNSDVSILKYEKNTHQHLQNRKARCVFHSEITFSGGIQLPHNFFTTLHYFAIGGFPGHHEKLIQLRHMALRYFKPCYSPLQGELVYFSF